MTETCEHHWFAWARGRKSQALQSIYCGDCRVVLSEFVADLRRQNEELRAHLAAEHDCRHPVSRDTK